MAKVRVHNFHVSLDGYSAGETITLDRPMGGAEGMFAGFDGRFIDGVGGVDAPITLDRALTSTWGQGIGAEIMGRGKFGPQTGEWTDDEWRGWWGDAPPFGTPVVVLSHHRREPLHFDNGTSFHFLDATPKDALAFAEDLAGGQDIRIGGGPSTVRQFLAAGLIDFMHLITVPVTLGGGVSMWEGLAGVQERFTVESTTSASGLTHHFWNRVTTGSA
ncbi:dihydrofolate reductase family protein [Streptomyces sp. NPDC007088]|uniref:dihydrofolate reductase family protein n=1 Tax=Streptomyces sp. NPDC007088 TaxID=3364773 RepID=UPI00369F2422